MGVYANPMEWAREMDRLMGEGAINKENYLTDCANAVVYVREVATKIKKLETELADMTARAEQAEANVAKRDNLLERVAKRIEGKRWVIISHVSSTDAMSCPSKLEQNKAYNHAAEIVRSFKGGGK